MKKMNINEPFVLESGEVLPNLEITYYTFGQLNSDASNVVWVCHALTGDANVLDWWPGLVGEGKVIDPNKDFIVCTNTLGSCYGTTGAASINPETGKKYGADFPFISIRDMVQAQQVLQKYLGIQKVKLGLGGSMGGQQLLEWAIIAPFLFENICLLATNARFSPWGIAFNESQRMAIYADLAQYEGKENAGKEGLKAARAIAMLSYKTYERYSNTQEEQSNEVVHNFKASTYQQYQGEKFWNRFDVQAYLCLTKAMDSHNVGRNRGGEAEALQSIKARTLIIGITSDVLFPIGEQAFLHKHIPFSQFATIQSFDGHDGFLTETAKITDILRPFRENKTDLKKKPSIFWSPALQNSFYKKTKDWALPGTEAF